MLMQRYACLLQATHCDQREHLTPEIAPVRVSDLSGLRSLKLKLILKFI